jgi:predicted metal-dependent hydrolase
MKQLQDDVLGPISVRAHHMSKNLHMRLSPKGELVVTVPPGTPLFLVKQIVKKRRQELLRMRESSGRATYRDQQDIGKSHKIALVRSDSVSMPEVRTAGRYIVATFPPETPETDQDLQRQLQTSVIAALRKEAKAYLPKRLARLAERHGFSYETTRFPHTISRWGSCSSQGTISLNIALMMLDLELIDYVLLHELCHTVQMNHSPEFWREVARVDPHYKLHRRQLRDYSPIV